jgi:hypothetical protein
MPTVLILGARAPIALEMARSFSAAGCKVIMADSLRLTLARWSNCVDAYYTLPAPNKNPIHFIEVLNTIIQTEKIDHLIPTCEEVFYVSMYKASLHCNVWTADFKLMDALHNKHTFIEQATPIFSVPKTIRVSDFTQWKQAKDFVFKPIYSRFASHVLINKDAPYCKGKITDASKWIAQERIFGKEICVYTIWEEGELKGYAAYHPSIRIGKGSGIYFEPHSNDALMKQVQSFGESIKYTGQLCFDFIVNESGAYVLECNPRGTSGAHLLNTQLADCFLRKDYFATNLDTTFSIKGAILLTKPLAVLTKRFHSSTDVVLKWKDLLPALLQPISLMEIAYIKFKHNTSWLGATTGDIEWNGNDD